jgi:hypothetical protein
VHGRVAASARDQHRLGVRGAQVSHGCLTPAASGVRGSGVIFCILVNEKTLSFHTPADAKRPVSDTPSKCTRATLWHANPRLLLALMSVDVASSGRDA